MNAKTLIAAVLVLAPAFGQFAAAATRAEVTAELYRARAAGEICTNDVECDRAPVQLKAAAAPRAALAASTRAACYNDAECDAAPSRVSTVTRAEVLAELYRARAAGEMAVTEADYDVGYSLSRARR